MFYHYYHEDENVCHLSKKRTKWFIFNETDTKIIIF